MRFLLAVLVAAFAFPAAAQMAVIQVPCNTYERTRDILAGEYSERPVMRGIQGTIVIEVWRSDAGTFTILGVTPDGKACMLGSGEGMEAVAAPKPAGLKI